MRAVGIKSQPPVMASGPLPPRRPVARLADVLRELAADRADR
jgi:hypothetical protein